MKRDELKTFRREIALNLVRDRTISITDSSEEIGGRSSSKLAGQIVTRMQEQMKKGKAKITKNASES
jgi:hypothetical protein